MAVEHIGSGISISIEQILVVVTQDRVMAEDYLAVIVVELGIGADPLEPGGVITFSMSELIVVSFHKAQNSLKLLQNFVGLFGFSEGEIAQYDHFVVPTDLLVPLLDHICIHFFGVREAAAIHLIIKTVMKKVTVGDVIAQIRISKFKMLKNAS